MYQIMSTRENAMSAQRINVNRGKRNNLSEELKWTRLIGENWVFEGQSDRFDLEENGVGYSL